MSETRVSFPRLFAADLTISKLSFTTQSMPYTNRNGAQPFKAEHPLRLLVIPSYSDISIFELDQFTYRDGQGMAWDILVSRDMPIINENVKER